MLRLSIKMPTMLQLLCCTIALLVMLGCQPVRDAHWYDSKTFNERAKINVRKMKQSFGGHYKVGVPYQVEGIWYYPEENEAYDEVGIASWYGPNFHKKRTANGEIFNKHTLTAAHPTLPMPSMVWVENLENGQKVLVRDNDRGPFAKGRLIDMSYAASKALGFKHQGTAKVRVTYDKQATDALFYDNGYRPNQHKRWYVQTGAFADEPSATSQRRALEGQYDAAIFDEDGLYKVRFGPFKTRKRADAALLNLQQLTSEDVYVVSK